MRIKIRFWNIFVAIILVASTILGGLSPVRTVFAATTDVFINEMVVSTTGTDWEFFELQGAPGTDLSSLTLIGIESDFGTSAGVIDKVIPLTGQLIPDDGYWLGLSSQGAISYGITGDLSISNDSFENGSATYFLVDGFSGSVATDYDVNDDGILDSTPWTSILDSVNIRDGGTTDFDYGAVRVGPDGTFLPAGGFRCADAPYGNFTATNIHNFSTPDGSPGRNNRGSCGLTDAFLNEMVVSTTSTDWEFFELQGASGTDLSTLSLIGIESDFGTTATGIIDKVISLSGQSIPDDGYWLGLSAQGAITYGITGDLSISNDSFENSTATYFLVDGFTGSAGTDYDLNDDGILDSTPWDSVLDSINIRDAGVDDFDYGAVRVGPDVTFLPAGSFRCPNAPDGSFVGNFLTYASPDGSPGVENDCTPPPTENCGDEFTSIFTIQGNSLASLLDGTELSTEGIVVGDFQVNGLNGFHIQDVIGDSDTSTSDGIFVSSSILDVSVGDHVRVHGIVDELGEMTVISSVGAIWLCSSGNTIPAPVEISLPVSDVSDFEKYEGMLVTFPQDLVISEYFNFDRYGEIVLTSTRHQTPTALYEPGSTEQAAAALAYTLDRITLDDGRSSQNPDPAIHPNGLTFDLDNLFRGGDQVTNVTGVLDYSSSLYRIQPTQGAEYTPVNLREATPPIVGGKIKVASFNVLNYFTTIDTGTSNWICGPSQTMECRGADTPEELVRQRNKIVAAISSINADVVGLMEIENNINDAAVIDLVASLNAVMGADTYDYIHTGVIGTDAIKVAMIYKPASLSLIGDFAILDTTVDSRFLDNKNRPVLAQSFQDPGTGTVFTVAVNHLKSKGSDCNDVLDPDLGDGAGNCNVTRENAALALVDWLESDPTNSGFNNNLIIGDLNSYDKEDPIDAIKAGSDDTVLTDDDYIDLVFEFQGEEAYGYVFDGQTGYLDHAMGNQGLEDLVTSVDYWHINADEPDLIDYDMSFKLPAQDLLYSADAYRSSDHDPVIIGLTFFYDYFFPLIYK